MDHAIVAIEHATTVAQVCDIGVSVAEVNNVARLSYHITPRFEQQISPEIVLCAHGFPKDWIRRYRNPEFRFHDPIPDHILERGKPMCLREAIDELRAKGAEAEEFFALLEEYDLLPGFGLPLFGPRNRNGYASVGFDCAQEEMDENVVAVVFATMQAAHGKIARLVDEMDGTVELSDRETTVLTQIAKGESNGAIARTLSISPDTVATYVKRIFAKLETNDRVDATVKGLKLGLIRV